MKVVPLWNCSWDDAVYILFCNSRPLLLASVRPVGKSQTAKSSQVASQ